MMFGSSSTTTAVLLHSTFVWSQVVPFWIGIITCLGTFASGKLTENLLCELHTLQFRQILNHCPQLSTSITQGDWMQTHTKGCHWLSGKGLNSLTNLNSWKKTQEEGRTLVSLIILIKIQKSQNIFPSFKEFIKLMKLWLLPSILQFLSLQLFNFFL